MGREWREFGERDSVGIERDDWGESRKRERDAWGVWGLIKRVRWSLEAEEVRVCQRKLGRVKES